MKYRARKVNGQWFLDQGQLVPILANNNQLVVVFPDKGNVTGYALSVCLADWHDTKEAALAVPVADMKRRHKMEMDDLLTVLSFKEQVKA